MVYSRICRSVLVIFCASMLVATTSLVSPHSGRAQMPNAPSSTSQGTNEGITPAQLRAKIDEIKGIQGVDDSSRKQALAYYQKALTQIEATTGFNASAKEFQETIESSSKLLEEIKQKQTALLAQEKKVASEPEKEFEGLSLSDAEQQLGAKQAEIATFRSELGRIDATLRGMASRQTAARAEQAAERQSLDALDEAIAAPRLGEAPIVAEARRLAQVSERISRLAKINLIEQELISLPSRQALTAARREFMAADLAAQELQIAALEARIDLMRQAEVTEKKAQAERLAKQLEGQSELLRSYARVTAEFNRKRGELAELIEQDRPKLAGLKAEVVRVDETNAVAQQIREIGAVTSDFGAILENMRAQIPAATGLQDSIIKRQQELVDARLQRLKLVEEQRTLGDAGVAARRLLASIGAAGPDKSPEANEQQQLVARLTSARAEDNASLVATYERRIEQLVSLNASSRELLDRATQLSSLLNERLLWLPTTAPFGSKWMADIASSAAWFSDAEDWEGTAGRLSRRIESAPVTFGLVVIVVLAIWGLRSRMRDRLRAIAGDVGQVERDTYFHTPEAFLITILRALTWPLLFGYAGLLLTSDRAASEFSNAIGHGLLQAAVVILVVRILHLMCAKNGLLSAHFNWTDRSRRMLGGSLSWILVFGSLAALLLGTIEASPSTVLRTGLGRLVYCLAALLMFGFVAVVFNPSRGPFAALLNRDGSLWLTRVFWYPLLMLAPLALAGLVLFGYYDGAVQLLLRFLASAVGVIVGAATYSLGIRLLIVAQRRLERRREIEAQAEAAERASSDSGLAVGDETVSTEAEMPAVTIASINQQTRTLLRTFIALAVIGILWLIWKPILPVLDVFDSVSLWTQTQMTPEGIKLAPVTLSNLTVGLLIAVLAVVLASNIPGFLEIVLLQRFTIDAGTRFAVAAISRYLIITVGLLIGMQRIGVDWSQLQWIVAALGVGLGFGLQEIVANFISGLIILFERPVRVGDLVTVGEFTGKVARIQIRATKIVDWDNREVIIPNKSFLTEKVVNWTLSERVTRVVVKVGVAYGSNTETTHQIIMETLKANPLVLAVPPPSAFFMGFGVSSLDFEARAFVAEPVERLQVLHELHTALERKLRENGIEIPFPQRDVHLRYEATQAKTGAKSPMPIEQVNAT